MSEEILKCLYDIKRAIEEIESYFPDREKSFEHYSENILLKRAIERDLEIIGEAMNRILKEDAKFPVDNAKRIVGLRNLIIHGYDSVSDENIWGIINNHIPVLKLQVEELIG
ncbi:HepT-like ribonuclease domain-containing protein [Membranihabitans maritimus]|uniref:HepT-like ribonuclease domain-containing protein n=1 Tax=Membranihabitans maritimus TaxID=2904244 RepID=UPI001F41F5C6|nr:HepT-like ribonuclease domain-containing protein [Membranihabitans maritimus]